MGTPARKPAAVVDLEAVFGGPSASGFGSATFWVPEAAGLEQVALDAYRRYVGGLWERYGEAAWMSAWRRVHARAPGGSRDVVAELRAIEDPDAARSVPMMLDGLSDPARGRSALAAAFDDPATTRLEAYNLGDGAAMSGLLLVGAGAEGGPATIVVFLMD